MIAPGAIAQRRVYRFTWTIGALAACLLAVSAYLDLQAALQSYLFVWWFLLGIPLGSMVLLMVHNLTGGAWGELIRPVLEAALSSLPFLLLLSIPLWLGMQHLYVWANPDHALSTPLIEAKEWYLNAFFFLLRVAIYFSAWTALSHLLHKWSFARHAGSDPGSAKRLRAISAVGLVVYGVTVTFAAVDWIMSLTPQWYSTTFGLLAGIGQALCAFSFATVFTAWFRPGEDSEHRQVFHDIGNLLLMFVMTWAYLAFTQYLIIWAENLPNEIVWYLPRVQTSWRLIALVLVVFHFALPFLVLLSRRVKRAPRALAALAATILLAHLVDAFWLVAPTFRSTGFAVYWSDASAALALGGLWLAAFMRTSNGATASSARTHVQTEAVDRV